MRKIVLTIVLFFASPALASGKRVSDLGPSDVYAGCVFSIAIPLMHHGRTQEKASAVAFRACEDYAKGIEETELQGVSDYVNLILEKIAEKPATVSAPGKCSGQFVEQWHAFNNAQGKGTMPTPESACVMHLPEGRGNYLCNNDGCQRK